MRKRLFCHEKEAPLYGDELGQNSRESCLDGHGDTLIGRARKE